MKLKASLPLPSSQSNWAHTCHDRLSTKPTNLDSKVPTPPSGRSPSLHSNTTHTCLPSLVPCLFCLTPMTLTLTLYNSHKFLSPQTLFPPLSSRPSFTSAATTHIGCRRGGEESCDGCVGDSAIKRKEIFLFKCRAEESFGVPARTKALRPHQGLPSLLFLHCHAWYRKESSSYTEIL